MVRKRTTICLFGAISEYPTYHHIPFRGRWQLSIAESSTGTHLVALLALLATSYLLPGGDTLGVTIGRGRPFED